MNGRLDEERGTIFVLIALALPAMLFLTALTLDVGNWYVSKHQLQDRADKGATAAALAYGYLYPQCTSNAALELRVSHLARQFAEDTDGSLPVLSGSQNTASVTINGSENPNVFGPRGGPCATQPGSIESPAAVATDVEVGDTADSVIGGFGRFTSLYGRSRVSVLQVESVTGWHPFVVADAGLLSDERAAAQPQCAWVSFDGGEPVRLSRDALDPHLFRASVPGQDVRGPAGGLSPIDADVIIGQGTANCDDTTTQIVTYPNVGYTLAWDSGTPSLPSITQVEISGGCDGNRGFVPRSGGHCGIFARAYVCFENADDPEVRFGGHLMRTDDGETWPPGSPGPPDCAWLGGSVTVAPGQGGAAGRVSVPIVAVNGNGADATLPYFVSAGNDLAIGPIADFRLSVVSRSSDPDPDVNPFTQDVELRLDPSASLTYAHGAPPVVLRGASVAGNPSSGPAHCPDTTPTKSLAEALRDGCSTFVTTTNANPTTQAACDVAGTLMCVSGSGDALGAGDYAERWGGVGCRNNWDDYPEIPRGDPRLIVVPITPPGARFPGTRHAVRYFAAFYVTGWDGDGGACGNEQRPQPLQSIGDPEGTIWGHFIKFVVPPSGGTARTTACAPEVTDESTGAGRVRACIATVVR